MRMIPLMTRRRVGCIVAFTLGLHTTTAGQQLQGQIDTALTVCLRVSQNLEMDAPLRTAVLAETARIWQPMGITIDAAEDHQNSCDRWILVKSALEAGPEDTAARRAIAWVPFVEKRARRVVFVRMSHARTLVESFSSTNMRQPPAHTDALVAKLVGRSLAHELGHVLLNSQSHGKSGLMRADYGVDDALRDLPSSYTLSASELEGLFAGD